MNINNVFIHGYFYLKGKKHLPKQKQIKTRSLNGNLLNIYPQRKTFVITVSKHIREYLIDQRCNAVVQSLLERTFSSKIEIVKVTAKVINFQASCTLTDCKVQYFYESILPKICQLVGVDKIGISQENSQLTGYVTVEQLQRGNVTTSFLLLEIGKKNSLKFQFSREKSLLHISAIFHKFDDTTKELFKLIAFFKKYVNSRK